MDIETRQAYSEVNRFLELIGEELASEIPKKLRDFLKREMDQTYYIEISSNKPIKNENFKRKTIVILSGLNLEYWCKDEKKKKQLLEIYNKNEIDYQEELRKKYNPDDVFNNRKKVITKEESLSFNNKLTIIDNEKWYKKLFKKIINIFHKMK